MQGREPEDRTMSEMNDWNAKVIAEFRANGGKVGGQFQTQRWC